MSSLETLMLELETEMPKRYAYDEILTFTSNFADRIGAGGFSQVYKGQFPDGVEVAVKVLRENDVIEDTFEAEVMTVGTIYHRSLVKLYGFCSEDNIKALVYEFMENSSLDSILYIKSGVIEWHQLYNIAVEIAKALAYLHHGCHVQIIHRDVKPHNILLDANFSAKLTDFGLANLMDGNESNTNIRGTPGYMAPEVWMHGLSVTFKCDVYSFGILLFEILGRRQNFDGNFEGETWFPEIVWNKFKKKEFDEIIGDCGIRDVDRKKATILATVALWCVQHTPETRPSMSTVATVLEKEMHVNMPPDPFSPSDPGISMHPEMNNPQGDSSTSDQRMDMQQISNSVKEQESQLTPEILGVESSNSTHTNIFLQQGPKKLTLHIQGRRDDGNEKKGEKFLAYVEKKRSVTNEVCGSILAKMEELQINCDTDTFEEEKKLEESHRYVEMKQSVTNEVCESILKIMKQV